MKKFIIITSIFEPTEAVRKFASLKDFQLVVVGDMKSPATWECENVVYLGVDDQKKMGFPILENLSYQGFNQLDHIHTTYASSIAFITY